MNNIYKDTLYMKKIMVNPEEKLKLDSSALTLIDYSLNDLNAYIGAIEGTPVFKEDGVPLGMAKVEYRNPIPTQLMPLTELMRDTREI